MLHVLNAPSPGATSSLAIGSTIAEKALRELLAPAG
jgi:L-2-hydroxyglutarate oxidase LhgO